MAVNNKSEEETKKNKTVVIVALVLAILCLGIGFASYSTLLTIESSLLVQPNGDNFSVTFSGSQYEVVKTDIVPVISDNDVTATKAVLNSNNGLPTVTNISAVFTKPGQWVEYSFYSYNSGKYMAYLNKVLFKNVSKKSSNKVCTALPGASKDMVQQVCDDIKLSIIANITPFSSTNEDISGHVIKRGGAEPIIVRLEYLDNDHWVDGSFTVDFGDVELVYDTID